MPDISMCQNNKCPKRLTCYRFIAIPDELLQAYSYFEPEENGECDGYLKSKCPECHKYGYHTMSCKRARN
jgi:hypothetical protein